MGHPAARLNALIAPAVEALGYEFVGLQYVPGKKSALVRVYIDAQGGITLDDCARVSYQVSGVLDVDDPIAGHYDLEVSSPGLDRPLFSPPHFERFRGSKVRVKTSVPVEGRRNFAGVLEGYSDGNVVVRVDGEVHTLPLEWIVMARLVPEC